MPTVRILQVLAVLLLGILLSVQHPALAQSTNEAVQLNKRAVQLYSTGRYSDEPLYKRALAIYEKSLGSENLNVALVLNNLAALYEAQGRYADAEPLYKR